ncbi:hypothetical protein GCM10010483_24050 [Actinokineospora diospyrosa]
MSEGAETLRYKGAFDFVAVGVQADQGAVHSGDDEAVVCGDDVVDEVLSQAGSVRSPVSVQDREATGVLAEPKSTLTSRVVRSWTTRTPSPLAIHSS